MTKNDGGPAFPEPVAIGPSGDVCLAFGGMSLRDYFAGQAIAGMLGNSTNIDSINEQLRHSMEDGLFDRILAMHAYEIADALIAARSSGGDADE